MSAREEIVVGMEIPTKKNSEETVQVIDVSLSQFLATKTPNSPAIRAYNFSGELLEGIPGCDLDMSFL
ncbi:MAG: hypothetical protein PF572_05370 [Patescibacteria group bacterium]|jgi:hypothetical protein|nr:hypothetical protein [Patescibacteria group bacterium]